MYLSRLGVSQVYSLHAPSLAFLGRQLPSWGIITFPGRLQPSQECCSPPEKAVSLPLRLWPFCETCSLPGRPAAFSGGLQPFWECNYTPGKVIALLGRHGGGCNSPNQEGICLHSCPLFPPM